MKRPNPQVQTSLHLSPPIVFVVIEKIHSLRLEIFSPSMYTQFLIYLNEYTHEAQLILHTYMKYISRIDRYCISYLNHNIVYFIEILVQENIIPLSQHNFLPNFRYENSNTDTYHSRYVVQNLGIPHCCDTLLDF